jgi:putative tricarboxylic transport membrane protein
LLGLFMASIGSGEDSYGRLSLGTHALSSGIPLVSAVVGVLILGEMFVAFEQMWRERRVTSAITRHEVSGDNRLHWSDIRRLFPYIRNSALIGTVIGALPGLGSTLAATLGYATARKWHRGPVPFGEGAPEGVAATEAANSAVSGANLIPVLSLGIPGNVGAVFLILAADSIGGFNPGPSVFRFSATAVNPELVVVFGIFTLMMLGNLLNWTFGALFMRWVGVLIRVRKQYLLPCVFLLTLTAIYLQTAVFSSLLLAVACGVLGYAMRKLDVSILPFVIAYILAGRLEETLRQAFAASGGDPWFLFKSPVAVAFLLSGVVVAWYFSRKHTA